MAQEGLGQAEPELEGGSWPPGRTLSCSAGLRSEERQAWPECRDLLPRSRACGRAGQGRVSGGHLTTRRITPPSWCCRSLGPPALLRPLRHENAPCPP